MTNHNPALLSLGLLAGLALTGAACAPDEEDDAVEFRTTLGCNCGLGGSNSAHVNLYPVDQVHLYGGTNRAGVTLQGIRNPSGTLYQLRTEGDEMYAFDSATLSNVADGAALVGWTIELYHAGNGDLLEIHVLAYDPAIPLPYDPGETISGWALGYVAPETLSETYSVCPASHAYPDAIAATIVRGELYDEVTGDVTANNEFMTIACFGNAVAKMKLFGYGPHEQIPGTEKTATRDQREATTRMITADYCGTGVSYTVDGTPLDWENAGRGVTPAGSAAFSDLEALWTEDGALCLNNPRLHDRKDVDEECELPECTEEMIAKVPHEWITWRVP